MGKQKTQYVCQQCGAQSAKWIGRCPACGEWNTYTEEIVQGTGSRQESTFRTGPKLQSITEIRPVSRERIKTGLQEFDRLLGGGLVPGSMVRSGSGLTGSAKGMKTAWY
jgi:DNA repair protein RadA/Sms